MHPYEGMDNNIRMLPKFSLYKTYTLFTIYAEILTLAV